MRYSFGRISRRIEEDPEAPIRIINSIVCFGFEYDMARVNTGKLTAPVAFLVGICLVRLAGYAIFPCSGININ